jgi:hypothetical protein
MFTRKFIAASLMGVALVMAGCGARDGVGANVGNEEPAITEPTIPTTPEQPVAPTPPPQPDQPLTVSIDDKGKTGGFLFWGKKATAKISVTNPNQKQMSGTLTITFSKGGSSVETQTQTVDLGPGENKTVEAKATKTSDDVSAFITTSSATTPGGGAAGPGAHMGGVGGGASAGTGGLPY